MKHNEQLLEAIINTFRLSQDQDILIAQTEPGQIGYDLANEERDVPEYIVLLPHEVYFADTVQTKRRELEGAFNTDILPVVYDNQNIADLLKSFYETDGHVPVKALGKFERYIPAFQNWKNNYLAELE